MDPATRSENIREIRHHLRFQPLIYINIFCSFILALYGVGILLITVAVRLELSYYLIFYDYYLTTPVYMLIFGSIFLVGISCLGLISNIRNIFQGIVTFGIILFGLFLFKIAMGTVALAVLFSANNSIREALVSSMENYINYNNSIDYVQTNLQCCGVDDFTEWNSTLGFIPGSCCNSDTACGFSDVINLNLSGCYEALSNLINHIIIYLLIILGSLGILEIITMTVTFFLVRGILKYRKQVTQNMNNEDQPRTAIVDDSAMKNPLALRRNLPRENRKNNFQIISPPFTEKKFMNQDYSKNSETHIRHPGNKDVFFGRGKNPQSVIPIAPPLPIENRNYFKGY